MAYWLFKSEPSTWSWDEQVAEGDAGEEWDGVRNFQARNYMRQMKVGDRGFFYHSQTDKEIVGTVEVIVEAHPDSTTDDERWECVDIKAIVPLKTPVSLSASSRNRSLPTWCSSRIPACRCSRYGMRSGSSSAKWVGSIPEKFWSGGCFARSLPPRRTRRVKWKSSA